MPDSTLQRGDAASPLTTQGEQQFLVGDHIYLRPAAASDADVVQSWMPTPFPVSPDRVRARIEEGETGDRWGHERAHLLVVRRSDERVVGSIIVHRGWFPHVHIDVSMDLAFGHDAVDAWLGEALAMTMRHVIHEWQMPIVSATVPDDHRATIAALEGIGARPCLRVPQLISRNGERVGTVMYEVLHPGWVQRVGDPADVDLPRSGTGESRPVIAPVVPDNDPPGNAIRVGPRVYLRPVEQRDATEVVRWRLRETEAWWSNGRFTEMPGVFWKEMEELQDSAHPSWVRFAVCLRENDALIGFVGIEGIDYRHRYGESESEILDPSYRGGGYGTEAKHLLFDYAFNTLDLHVLLSWVFFDNTRSAAALRKQGYRDTGRVHWVVSREGGFANMGIFTLRADDWRAMPRQAATEEHGS